MRILLTGTSGQVGGALLPLLRGSHEVLAPSRTELDFSRPETLATTLDRFKPDLIINPAAYTAVDRVAHQCGCAGRASALGSAA
jgi:dTDP-4-dehydrorhamnose reductase